MIVVQWIFSHPKSNKIIQGSFDLFAAYFCEVQINAGSSVNLDAAVEPASVSRRKQDKWVRLSSFTYFPKEFSPLILKLKFNYTTVKLFLELSDESLI